VSRGDARALATRLFALLITVPVVILWVAAVVDVLRRGGSGLRIAGVYR
jgi:hypothetical protein